MPRLFEPGDEAEEGEEGNKVPVQPKRPGRVQRQRRRVVLAVLLCDVFQLFLVDVNVVFAGNAVAARGASVRLQACLPGGKRHVSGADEPRRSPPSSGSPEKHRFCVISSPPQTQPLFRPPTDDVIADVGVAVGS